MQIEIEGAIPGWFKGLVRRAGVVVFETEATQDRSDAREQCEDWIGQQTGRTPARHRAIQQDREEFMDSMGF